MLEWICGLLGRNAQNHVVWQKAMAMVFERDQENVSTNRMEGWTVNN